MVTSHQGHHGIPWLGDPPVAAGSAALATPWVLGPGGLHGGVVREVPLELLPLGVEQDPLDARLAKEHEAALPEHDVR